jgi:hypothetical protein
MASTVSNLCKLGGWRGVHVVYSVAGESPKTWDTRSFALYGPDPTDWLNQIRVVSCMNDGGTWKFFQRGTPQTFELLDSYELPRIQDRFGFDQLHAYCLAMGFDPWNESAYSWDSSLMVDY